MSMINSYKQGRMIFLVLFSVLAATLAEVAYLMINDSNSLPVSSSSLVEPEVVETDLIEIPGPIEEEVVKIDFQPVVDAWVGSTGGEKSVYIYDLDRDEAVGDYNSLAKYNTASLYKLFVVYEGYRKVQIGAWEGNAPAGRTGRTVLQCLDAAIRSSDSECAETLWGMIGRDELSRIIVEDFEATETNLSNLTSNPQDIAKIMQIFYQHKEITDENLVSLMKDSFLNQPKTIYDWRQGLPRGFSVANVYNKVGWDFNPNGNYWNIYHDAAIVEYPDADRHFLVVVMSKRLAFEQIRRLGQEIENLVLTSIGDQ